MMYRSTLNSLTIIINKEGIANIETSITGIQGYSTHKVKAIVEIDEK